MATCKNQHCVIVRKARDGDYGWEPHLDQVIVKFDDDREETALRSEVNEADVIDGVNAANVIKQSENEDTRDASVKRAEVDAERHGRTPVPVGDAGLVSDEARAAAEAKDAKDAADAKAKAKAANDGVTGNTGPAAPTGPYDPYGFTGQTGATGFTGPVNPAGKDDDTDPFV